MIHPQVRAINTQLMSVDERANLQMAIETMVMFDLQLKPASSTDVDVNEARWNPDLSSLVQFSHRGCVKPHMPQKVQSLVH